MSAFELFFSLFGLILGLAIASLAAAGSDILRDNRRTKIGGLTPCLVVFLLIDLTSFWIYSYRSLQHIHIGFSSMLWALGLAVTYFFAVGVALPKNAEQWQSLDEYYLSHYRWVLGGVLLANVGLITLSGAMRPDGALAHWVDLMRDWQNIVYVSALVALIVFRNRFVQFACYAALFINFAISAANSPLSD
jgi:hypothetical protein